MVPSHVPRFIKVDIPIPRLCSETELVRLNPAVDMVGKAQFALHQENQYYLTV